MASWISMDEACRQLGVRAQTVYPYGGRGKLGVIPAPADTRRSLYRAEHVAALAKRKQAGRKHETLATNTLFGAEPSIATALTAFFKGRPHYRGRDAVELARAATLEEAAQWMWEAEQPVDFASVGAKPALPAGRAAAFTALAQLAASGHSTRGRLTRVLHQEGQGLAGPVAHAFAPHALRPAARRRLGPRARAVRRGRAPGRGAGARPLPVHGSALRGLRPLPV